MNAPNKVLQVCRTKSGMTPAQVALRAGISEAEYYDCEDGNDLVAVISLDELDAICRALGIRPFQLFCEPTEPVPEKMSRSDLIASLKRHLSERKISSDAFGDSVGFEIESALADPEAVGEWSVEWLQWLCSRIGAEWKQVMA